MRTDGTRAVWRPIPWVVVLVIALGAQWALLRSFAISGERAARPLAGPAERVAFVAEPGTRYRIYAQVPTGSSLPTCRIAPAGNDATGLSLDTASTGTSAVNGVPAVVLVNEDRYQYALEVTHAKRIEIGASCDGVAVLVESGTDIRWPVVAGLAAEVAAAAAVVWIWWAKRRKSRSR